MAIGTTTGTAGAAALMGATMAASTAALGDAAPQEGVASADTASGFQLSSGHFPFTAFRSSPFDRWSRALGRARAWLEDASQSLMPVSSAMLPILVHHTGTIATVIAASSAATLVHSGILAASAVPAMPDTTTPAAPDLPPLPTVVWDEIFYRVTFQKPRNIWGPLTTLNDFMKREALVDIFSAFVQQVLQGEVQYLRPSLFRDSNPMVHVWIGDSWYTNRSLQTLAQWFGRYEKTGTLGKAMEVLRTEVQARLAPDVSAVEADVAAQSVAAEAPSLPVEKVTPHVTPPDPLASLSEAGQALARLAASHPTLVETLLTVVRREFRDEATQRTVVDAVVRLSDLMSPETIWERLGRAPHVQVGFFHEAVRTARLLEAGIPLTAVSREFPQEVVYEGWLMSQDGLYFAPREKKDRVDADAIGQDGTVYELKWMNTGFGGEKGEMLEVFRHGSRLIRVDPSKGPYAYLAMKLYNQVQKLGAAVQSGMIPRVEFHITSSKPLNPLVVELIQSSIPQVKIVVYPKLEATVAEATVLPDSPEPYWERVATPSGKLRWQRRTVNPHQLHAQIAEIRRRYTALEGSIRDLEGYRKIEARVLDQLEQLHREVDALTLAGLADWEGRWASVSGVVTSLSDLNLMLNQIDAYLRANRRVVEADVRRMVRDLKVRMNDFTGSRDVLDQVLGDADFLVGYLQLAEAAPEVVTVATRREFLLGMAIPLLQDTVMTQDHLPRQHAFEVVRQFVGSLSDDRIRQLVPDAVMEEADPESPLRLSHADAVTDEFRLFKSSHPELWEARQRPGQTTPPAMPAAKVYSDKEVERFLGAVLKEEGLSSGFSNWGLRHTPDLRNFSVQATLQKLIRDLGSVNTHDSRKLSADIQTFLNEMPGQSNAPFPIARKKAALFALVRRYMALTSENEDTKK